VQVVILTAYNKAKKIEGSQRIPENKIKDGDLMLIKCSGYIIHTVL
jgi:hypothetical protein